MSEQTAVDPFGPNAWLVDEMRARWADDPASVSDEWRAVFGDAVDGTSPSTDGNDGQRVETAPPAPPPAPATASSGGEPLRGAAARIVANMEASLEVPTATSFRDVPAKLLEVNRSVI